MVTNLHKPPNLSRDQCPSVEESPFPTTTFYRKDFSINGHEVQQSIWGLFHACIPFYTPIPSHPDYRAEYFHKARKKAPSQPYLEPLFFYHQRPAAAISELYIDGIIEYVAIILCKVS